MTSLSEPARHSGRRPAELLQPRDSEIADGLLDRAGIVLYRFQLRPDRRCRYVSAGILGVAGYRPDELLDDPDLWLRIIDEQDRRRLAQAIAVPLFPQTLVLRWVHRDGEPVWMEHRIWSVRERGRWAGIDGVARGVPAPASQPPLVVGGLVIERERVLVDGVAARLTRLEHRLLTFLALRRGPVSRDELMRELWDSEHVGNGRSCEAHISHLRRKIERDPRLPERLVTLRGYGYELRPA